MPYLISLPGMALSGVSIASAEDMKYFPYGHSFSGGGHIELTNVTLAGTHSSPADHPLFELHYKTVLPNFNIRELNGAKSFQIVDGYVSSVAQYFDNASYEYSKISIYAKDLLYMSTLPALSLFLLPDSDYKRYDKNFKTILELGKRVVVARTTTDKPKITEPPILVSRQIVICRH